MKKSKKILMATVAILLCLVLLSSSIVSGIYAKFVITKSAELPVKFKAFGVTVGIYNSSDITEASRTTNGNSVSVTYSNLNMQPGVVKENVIRFVFGGQQNVPVKVIFKVDIQTHNDFIIDAADFDSISASTAFMPMQFVCGTVANKDATTYANADTVKKTNAWLSATPYLDTTSFFDECLEKELAGNVKSILGTSNVSDVDFDGTCAYVSKTFSKTEAIAFANSTKGIGFGFEWPLGDRSDTSTEAALHNAIESYLVEKFDTNEVPITITFTVSVEQTGA